MVRINSIGNINITSHSDKKTNFKGEKTVDNPQIKELSGVKPDFDIKTPISYTKTGEIDFPYNTKAYCYKLSNGQKVVIVPQEGETVLKTYVNTGSMNEPDNLRGISHYIEHNLFNGSEGLEEGDFFKQVNNMGASTNAATGFGETNYYIASNLLNKDDLETKIKLHASMLETPRFAVEKLEKEKGIVNSEINMIVSDPENIAVNKMLKNLYGIKTSSVDMIGGTTDNITNLKREDVVNYYNNNYYPANMTTVITGDVNPDETMKLLSKYFTSKKQPSGSRYFEKLNPTQKQIREDVISDKASGTFIVTGFNGPASNNAKDTIYIEALGKILANSPYARIDKEIKKYNTSAYFNMEKISSNPNDGKALTFITESTDENSEKVLKTFFNQIGNIVNNPPTEEEMQIVKKQMLNSFSDVFEHTGLTNSAIGTTILENNLDGLINYENIVKSMTAKDLVETAKKYLDVNKASVTVVHPTDVNPDSIKTNHKNAQTSFTGRKQALDLSDVKEYNTNNNYRVVLHNSKTNKVDINYNISLDTIPDKRLITKIVLGRLLKFGTKTKSQEEFTKELAKNGIDAYFFANSNNIACELRCDSSDTNFGMEKIKEVFDNPNFTEESFEKIKNIVKDELVTSEKSAYDKLDSEIYKELPHSATKEELLKDLEKLTLNDVKALYNEILNNGKGHIVVCGPFDRNPELKNTVFSNIAKFNPVKEFSPKVEQTFYTPVEKTKVLTEVDCKNQAQIIQAFKYKRNENIKDLVTTELLNNILGGSPSSRLFMDLREKEKLAYNVFSDFDYTEDIGNFMLAIKTTTENSQTGEVSFDNVQKSIDGFNKHIQEIKTNRVSDEELKNAKLKMKNSILSSTHTPHAKNSSLSSGLNSPYGISRTNQIFDLIDTITADDIYNAANYIFSGKPVYSIVATKNTLDANKDYFNKLANM